MTQSEPNSPLIATYGMGISENGVLQCGVCRQLGRCRLGIIKEELLADGTYFARVICGPENEGGPNVSHGGWSASVLDDALGHMLLLKGRLIVTKSLAVDYLKPVPLAREMTCHGHVEKHEGKFWYMAAELRLGEAVLTRARGVFVERDPTHFTRFENWIAEQS